MVDTIHVTRWGDRGPRVVLIHGGAQGTQSAGHKNFWAQEPLAAQGWQLIVPDRPGHGSSAAPGRRDDPAVDAAALTHLLGDGAHLVGHSFGGLVALAMVAARPDAVKSLTLIEPALHKVAVRHPAVRKAVLGLAWTMLMPYRPATKSRRAMGILGIPADQFELSEAELDSMGKALSKANFPSRSTMEGWLSLVRDKQIPFQILSGSASPSFIGVGETAAPRGGGTNLIVPSKHHFPQWEGTSFNAVLSHFWDKAEKQ